jgi:iodotyrosine deiodinase
MESQKFIPYPYTPPSDEALIANSQAYKTLMQSRRSIRFFSEKHVPKEVIENLIMTAASAPSGAHKQPWTFCAVSSPDIKKQIRIAAEAEEYVNYQSRMSEEWLDDLKKFDTNHIKPFLDIAPWLIIIFKKPYDLIDGEKRKNYYVSESVGIAAGMLISAIHYAGLVTLTHTPSPMNFLQEILDRPENEKPYLLLPVGYPADDATVPDLTRKTVEEVLIYF